MTTTSRVESPYVVAMAPSQTLFVQRILMIERLFPDKISAVEGRLRRKRHGDR